MSTYDGAYSNDRAAPTKQPDWCYPSMKNEEDTCPHERIDRWNHGYHAECLDCGKQLY